MLKSKEWSVKKIFQLAQLHVSIIDDLKPIYVQHIQDLNNLVGDNVPLLNWFYDLTTTRDDYPRSGHVPSNQLLHSIHNITNKIVKVALVQSAKYLDAIGQLKNLPITLRNTIDPSFHDSVFIAGK
jgi:hypothetical protein